jgi:SAM-dependent methyltransferase
MPDDALLARMYGPEYTTLTREDGQDDPKEPGRVIEWLRQASGGLFLDFGCGQGELLVAARDLGWKVAGVELDASIARDVSRRLGLTVLAASDEGELARLGMADILHLGDVIEHLTRPQETVRSLLRLVKPGGLVLAQGPLEAGPCLFTTALRVWQRMARPAARAMAPYHVIQATISGQRQFFVRLGLEEIEYRVSEVAWPAPAHFPSLHLVRPRTLALWGLRQVSMLLSRASPEAKGNRYFYAGRPREHLERAPKSAAL